MTHLDLFSGVGGFALACRWLGIETIGFSEIDPFASAVLKKHWPTVPNYGDIRNVRGVHADLVSGGFPCQPFSLAGKRRGKKDDRYLWPEMLRVIDEGRPAFVLAENVPGIVNMELDRVLSDLENIGYAARPIVIPACAVDARHRRDRVWILAHSQYSEWRPNNVEGGRDCERQDSKRQASSRTGKCGEILAHDAMPGCEHHRQVQARTKQSRWDTSGGGGGHVPDANGIHAGTGRSSGSEAWDKVADGCWRLPEPDLGGVAARISAELDGLARWPDEDPQIPRIAVGVKNRVQRLKCLGNSIVPQVAYQILKVIIKLA